MKIVIFGATGMVGKGVLLESLADEHIPGGAPFGHGIPALRDFQLRIAGQLAGVGQGNGGVATEGQSFLPTVLVAVKDRPGADVVRGYRKDRPGVAWSK